MKILSLGFDTKLSIVDEHSTREGETQWSRVQMEKNALLIWHQQGCFDPSNGYRRGKGEQLWGLLMPSWIWLDILDQIYVRNPIPQKRGPYKKKLED